MLELIIGDTNIPLSDNTAIGITANNPIFDKESVSRQFSYPFQLPLSPVLRQAIRHQDRLDARDTEGSYAATVVVGGQPLPTGTIVIGDDSKSNLATLDVHFQNTERDLLTAMEGVKVNDILGTLQIPQTIEGARYVFKPIPQNLVVGREYYLRINDIDFRIVSTTSDIVDVIIDMVTAVNAQIPGIAYALTVAGVSDVFLEIRSTEDIELRVWAFDYLMRGWTLQNGWRAYSDARLSNFRDFIRVAQTTPRADVAFPTLLQQGFYGTKNAARIANRFNSIYTEGGVVKMDIDERRVVEEFRWSYMPCLRLSFVLERVRVALGLAQITGDFLEWSDLADALIYSNVAIDELTQRHYMNLVSREHDLLWVNQFQKTIALGDLLPEYTARDFMSDIAATFTLTLHYQDNRIIFRKKQMPFGKRAEDWTAFAIRDHEKAYRTPKGFELKYTIDENDKSASSSPIFTSKIVGAGTEKFALPISTLALLHAADLPYNAVAHVSFALAACQQEGTTAAFGIGKKKTTLKLLHTYEEMDTLTGRVYKVASPRNIREDGTQAKSFSFRLLGSMGMYKTWWEGYAAALANGSGLTKYFLLDVSELQKILIWQNPNRFFDDDKGRFEGVVKSVQFTATRQRGKLLTKVVFVNLLT